MFVHYPSRARENGVNSSSFSIRTIERLLHDETAKAKAADFARSIAEWDGPKLAAQQLLERYGREEEPTLVRPEHRQESNLRDTGYRRD